MDMHHLPFEVDQLVEAKSFLTGYRGAWFRCKIKDIRQKICGMTYALEYYDFPDEKVRWTKIYQKANKSKVQKLQLMVRPCFPPVYRESQLPDVDAISEALVTTNDVWKVGDLVDWWADGCYWSGKIMEVLGNEKFRIELPAPPIGEGLSYEAACKDLRPSLDWSPEHGWILPFAAGCKNHHSCARLIKPVNQGRKDHQATVRASHEQNTTPPLLGSEKTAKRPLNTVATTERQTGEINLDLHRTGGGDTGNTSCSDGFSSSHARGASSEVAGDTIEKDNHVNSGASKKIRTEGSVSLNSSCIDTIDAAIIDLEELVNRINWIKSFLEFPRIHLSNARQLSWKYVDHRPSSGAK